MSAYTVPDQIVVDGFPFHDAEYHPTERWTIAGIIAHSSNVGMVQVVQHVSPQMQYDYFRNFGIGEPSAAAAARGQRRAAVPGVASGPATSGTRCRSARASRSPRCRWPASTRRSRTAGSGSAPTIVAGTTNTSGQYVPAPKPGQPPGPPGQDRARADGHPAAGAVGGRPGRRAVGRDPRATRSRPRPAPRRSPTRPRAAACACTDRASSASPRPATRSWWSRSTCRTRGRAATSASTWPVRCSTR